MHATLGLKPCEGVKEMLGRQIWPGVGGDALKEERFAHRRAGRPKVAQYRLMKWGVGVGRHASPFRIVHS